MELRTIAITIIGLLFAASFPAPPAAAQAILNEQPMLDLYLTATGLDTTKPTKSASESRSILSNGATPGLTFVMTWGTYKFPHDVTFTTNAVMTVWLTSTQATPATNIRAAIQKAGVSYTGQTGRYADSATTGDRNVIEANEQERFVLGFPVAGTTWTEGEALTLTFAFFGVAAAGTPTDVKALFGSTVNPSRITIGVDDAGELPSESSALSLFLGDKVLDPTPPAGAADLSRASESTGNAGTISTVATAAAFSWGKYKTTSAFTISGDTTITVWVTGSGNAMVMRGLRAYLYIGGSEVANEAVGTDVWTHPAYVIAGTSPSVTQNAVWNFVVGIPTTGIEVEADSDIEVRFATWSTTDANTGRLTFLYGSKGRPAAVTIPVAGGATPGEAEGAVVPVSMAVADDTLEAAPGGVATFALDVTNADAAPHDLSFQSSANATVTFDPPMVSIPAGGSASTNVTVAVPADAAPGASIPVRIAGLAGEAELVNITVTVNVVVASQGGASSQGGSSATPGASTGAAAGSAATDEGSDTPGPGFAALVLGILGLAWLRRRRA